MDIYLKLINNHFILAFISFSPQILRYWNWNVVRSLASQCLVMKPLRVGLGRSDFLGPYHAWRGPFLDYKGFLRPDNRPLWPDLPHLAWWGSSQDHRGSIWPVRAASSCISLQRISQMIHYSLRTESILRLGLHQPSVQAQLEIGHLQQYTLHIICILYVYPAARHVICVYYAY